MNYDMTFCTGGACPLMETCERHMDYIDRPKNRPLSWFMDPPFEGETCEHYKPLSKNTREGE